MDYQFTYQIPAKVENGGINPLILGENKISKLLLLNKKHIAIWEWNPDLPVFDCDNQMKKQVKSFDSLPKIPVKQILPGIFVF